MFKKKESDFTYFNEEWNRNEPTTDEDYLEDGIYDYVSTPNGSKVVED
jgi:hypothetical protein